MTQHVSGRLSELDFRMVRAIPAGGNWRDIPVDVPSRRLEQMRESFARGEGSRSTYYGRLRWDEPSYTISTYYNRPGNGCTIHPTEDRMLTDREAARLQTFPDHVRFFGPARARMSQIGNAMPPLLAASVLSRLPSGTLVDLFSGAGGLSMGAELAGHELVAAVDNDPHASRTHAQMHHADAAVVQCDLSNPQEADLVVATVNERLAGRTLGVLAGGPPCQGFSTAGPCQLDDSRNRLLAVFVDLALRLQPEAVVIENVTGLLFRGRGLLDETLRRLEAAGYVCGWAVLHAEAFGVPQRRRRLVAVATRTDSMDWPRPTHQTASPSYPRLQPHHADDAAPSSFTVRDAIGDLPPRAASSPDEEAAYHSAAATPLQSWFRGEGPLPVTLEGATAITAAV